MANRYHQRTPAALIVNLNRLSLFFFLVLATFGISKAGVVEENRCYFFQPRKFGEQHYALKLHIYRDQKTGKEIFASIQYKEDTYIAAVWYSTVHPDTEEDMGNYETKRVEVINGKITGEYLEVKTGAGNRQGEYLEYISKTRKNKEPVIFFPAEYSQCKQVCANNSCRLLVTP